MVAAARIVNIAKAKIAVLRNRLIIREYTSPPDYAVCCETGGAKNERSPDIAYSRRVAALRPQLRPQWRNVSRRFPAPPAMRQLCPQYLAQRHAVFVDHVPGVASFISSSPLSLRREPIRSNHSACAAVHRMMFQFYMAF